MNLYETTPDLILEEIENRSNALMEAEQEYVEKETNFKAWCAGAIVAHKNAGNSVAAAENLMKVKNPKTGENPWADMYQELNNLAVQVEKLKRDHRRAMLAAELWRTEQSNRRVV